MKKFLAVMLLLAAATAANAQTYNVNGTLKGLAGEDYEVTGTATFDDSGSTLTITGELKSTTPQPPPSQCQTISAPNGTFTDSNGAVFSWGPPTSGGNWGVMRNGQVTTFHGEPHGGNVAAIAMSLVDGTVFNRHLNGEWRQWSSSGWRRLSGPPSGC